jgi:hypothetical protein
MVRGEGRLATAQKGESRGDRRRGGVQFFVYAIAPATWPLVKLASMK